MSDQKCSLRLAKMAACPSSVRKWTEGRIPSCEGSLTVFNICYSLAKQIKVSHMSGMASYTKGCVTSLTHQFVCCGKRVSVGV